jgi:hypothetical protein
MGSIGPQYAPGVQRLPVDAPVEDFIALLKRDGGVIVKGFVPLEVIDQCNEDIRPMLEREQKWHGEFFPVGIFPCDCSLTCWVGKYTFTDTFVLSRKKPANAPP